MPVTESQAQQLVTLVLACRPIGAPRWDAGGVMAAVRKVAGLQLADVIRAAVNAAEDRSLVTPGAISNTGSSCWRAAPVGVKAWVPDVWDDPTDRCAECSKARLDCEKATQSGHSFRSVHEHNRLLAEKRLDIPATVRGCKTITAEQEPST